MIEYFKISEFKRFIGSINCCSRRIQKIPKIVVLRTSTCLEMFYEFLHMESIALLLIPFLNKASVDKLLEQIC